MRGGCEDDLGSISAHLQLCFELSSRPGRRIAKDKIVSRPKSEAALYGERGRCRFKKPICREMLGPRRGPKKQTFPVMRSDCIPNAYDLVLFFGGSSFYEEKKNTIPMG